MAAASISVEQDQFSCSICLDLLKDPVAIPCGHSYCMDCIKGYWDQDDHTVVCTCPQCRETFTPRPVLRRNTMLAEVVEKLKKTGLQAAPPAHCYAGPGDVACDVCTGRKLKAVKSCLMCLVSYCESHLQPHCELPAFKKHKLVKTTRKLEETLCFNHDKLLEVYCRTDQQCICYLCTMDEHRGHDTVSAAAERTEKQRKFQQRIQEREKELQDLRQAVESLTCSAQAAVEDSERIFTELIRSIERRCSEMTQLIRDQEKATVSQAEGVMERLEQEIAELRRRDAELEQLSHTEDHIHFLQSCQSLSSSPECGDLPSITVDPHVSFGFVTKSVSELKERLEDICKEELVHKSLLGISNMAPKEPRSRAEFLQYSCQLTLDPNTANTSLRLSEGNRAVTWGTVEQPYPGHPERFACIPEVLCREGLSGRCYWEAEWSGDWVYVAVSYKEISRKGRSDDCCFGCNEKSWMLRCSVSECSFWHNNKKTVIPAPTSSRIGVYLDHRAGTLSFYSVSDTMTLLHRVQTTFTQPLYPGFMGWIQSTVKLCPLE
ncbi:tripartite motif-containing protein 16-like isoform X9 [Megalops cyprinoides]|uniref:tripartite motif-containing protein 16-like isoform X9 n=1 Tax=Megalops cyprinoides TaxID=118141 RepID=UPI0018651566|nr:tripartite motif-containing protein 16-like isoform X9 [Megalops cyprinoides]